MEREEFEKYQRILDEGLKPEEILGVSPNADLAEIEAAFESRKQGLVAEKEHGNQGDGSRVISEQEFEHRMAELEKVYEDIKRSVLPTQELDPDFPNRIKNQ